jgi:hypothetical protein
VRLSKRMATLLASRDQRLEHIKRLQFADRIHGKTDLVVNSLAKDLHYQVNHVNMNI